MEHEEAIISLAVITSRNVGVLLELPFYLFIALEADPALVGGVRGLFLLKTEEQDTHLRSDLLYNQHSCEIPDLKHTQTYKHTV